MFAQQFSLFPPQASTTAQQVDALFWFLVIVTGAAGVLVTLLIIGFAIAYQRRTPVDRTPRILGSLRLELFWTITPFLIFLIMFYWGASIYFAAIRPPDNALEVYVVGKQWMWKIQHSSGQREINELHVPVNTPVHLILTSEDVIHDFGLPDFRIKRDVIPNRYTSAWFQANQTGEFHLFCDQYCGTNHSGMIGTIKVQSAEEFGDWLNSRAEGSLALQGRKHFLRLQCITCHNHSSRQHAPQLENLYMQEVRLRDGRIVTADESYLRRSILEPAAEVVQGWDPIMPIYKGQLVDEDEKRKGVTEDEILIQLIAYIKSMRNLPPPEQTPPGSANRLPDRTEEEAAPITTQREERKK